MTVTELEISARRRADAPAAAVPLEPALCAIPVLARVDRVAREEAAITVGQPRSRLVCVVPQQVAGGVVSLFDRLEAELNVRTISPASWADSLVPLEAKPNFRSLGKKFGKSTAPAAAAFRQEQRLRGDLTFAVSERIRVWIVASAEVQAGVSGHHDWVANELLARRSCSANLRSITRRRALDPDGSVVRLALTKDQ